MGSVNSLVEQWRRGKEVIDRVTTDFQSIDNITDGVPLNQDPDSPFVADTTIPGLVRDTVRAAIKEVPIFALVLNGTKNSINAHIGSFLLRDRIFNEDTFGKGILSTLQIGAEDAFKHGFCPFLAATGLMYDDFGTQMRMLHWDDVVIEPGVSDASESSYFMVRANLTKSRVRKILESAKNDPDTTWNVTALEDLLETAPQSLDYTKDLSEMRFNNSLANNTNTYEIITKYEVGMGGEVTTFSPQVDEPLRTFTSRSKFGYPRQLFLVIDPVALSPYGLSRVRLASPMQNFANVFLQSVAKMQLLNADPPVMKRGRFTTPIQLKRGVVWESLDQNATAELKELSNSTLQNFTDVMSFTSAQIHNMFGRPPGGTMAGGSNNMGYSKTAPGVKMQEKDLNTSDAQLTNLLENFLRQYALVAFDLTVSEQVGVTTIRVDDEAKNAINRIIEEQNAQLVLDNPTLDPAMIEGITDPIGDDNKITVNWEEYYADIETMSITIEMSLGKDELEEKKRGDVQDTLVTMTQNAQPGDMAKQAKINELEDRLLEKTVPDMSRDSGPTPQPQPPINPGQPV